MPSNVSTRAVAILYFLVVFLVAAAVSWVAQSIAPKSGLASWIDMHFDAVFFWALGIFLIYMLGMTFWQAFFPPKDQDGNENG